MRLPLILLFTLVAIGEVASADPVAWAGLDGAAFSRAAAENKPVYVLVTTRLHELSRSTLKSLENPETAAYFNTHFICVKIDRDDRPDFAAAAQQYLIKVKQLPGWPAHLWLTPKGKPFDGANYLPPAEEWGKKSLSEVAHRNSAMWEHSATAAARAGAEAVAMLTPRIRPPRPGANPVPIAAPPSILDSGEAAWLATYDAAHPGFGDPPRYPEPDLLRFLLARGGADADKARAVLRAVATSALHDPLDGGFFRYVQDVEGRLPYPQKTLGDQARIALAYLDAVAAQSDPDFADTARGALDYVLTRLALGSGFYAAGEDGTQSGLEGYFAWKTDEIAAVLGPDATAFGRAYSVAPAGNIPADADPSGQFTGRNLLRRAVSTGDLSLQRSSRARMLAVRDRRGRLPLAERQDPAAHGMLLAAFVRAHQVLGDARYAQAAQRLAALLPGHFVTFTNPVDGTALALGLRAAGDNASADRILAACDARFLNGKQGYAAAALPLEPGVFVRAPASFLCDRFPQPESMALLAGCPAATASLLRQALSARAAGADLPPGDALLALRKFSPEQ